MSATVELGRRLFGFESFDDWADRAAPRYLAAKQKYGVTSSELVAVDGRGRICTLGLHFKRAEEAGAFPVSVHHVDPDWRPAK